MAGYTGPADWNSPMARLSRGGGLKALIKVWTSSPTSTKGNSIRSNNIKSNNIRSNNIRSNNIRINSRGIDDMGIYY